MDDYVLTGNTSYPTSENLIIENAVNQVRLAWCTTILHAIVLEKKLMKTSQWGFWLVQNDPDGVVSLPVRIPSPLHPGL